jgi:hypothetical protein
LQDVDPINIFNFDKADAILNIGIESERCKKKISLIGRELFAVIEMFKEKILGKNTGGRYDWTCERASPRFIDSGNPQKALGPEVRFEFRQFF